MSTVLDFLRIWKDDLAFLLLFAVIFFFFLKDFKLTSKNSWIVLLGLTALGAFFGYRAWQRRKLLAELEARQRELEKVEERLKALMDKQKITQEAYEKARADLERAKSETALAILRADRQHAERVAEIEEDYKDMTADELVGRVKKILQK